MVWAKGLSFKRLGFVTCYHSRCSSFLPYIIFTEYCLGHLLRLSITEVLTVCSLAKFCASHAFFCLFMVLEIFFRRSGLSCGLSVRVSMFIFLPIHHAANQIKSLVHGQAISFDLVRLHEFLCSHIYVLSKASIRFTVYIIHLYEDLVGVQSICLSYLLSNPKWDFNTGSVFFVWFCLFLVYFLPLVKDYFGFSRPHRVDFILIG